MPVLGAEEIKTQDIDALAIRVFLKALEIIGGPRKLILYRNLTWIPSLLEAAYAIVLANEYLKTEEEIAAFTGLTRQTVRNILRADAELVLKKLEGERQEKRVKAHTAGGLAKLAYQEIKEGRDNLSIFTDLVMQGADALGITWPIEVLKRIKGMDFPLEKEKLKERLRGLKIKDKAIETLLDRLSYPLKSPAQLLKELRMQLEKE